MIDLINDESSPVEAAAISLLGFSGQWQIFLANLGKTIFRENHIFIHIFLDTPFACLVKDSQQTYERYQD